MLSADYQQFVISDAGLTVMGPRMAQKLHALAPTKLDFYGKTVLDVGCDHGFWSFLAADQGAIEVLGVDRGRNVKGEGFVDLVQRNNHLIENHPRYDAVRFERFEAGRNWWDLGPFNIVLLMSLYHHVYQNTGGDHAPIWYWLWRQTDDVLLWENPTDARDAVVQANVAAEYHGNYTRERILDAASEWFDLEYAGPAEHEPYREVWYMKRKAKPAREYHGMAFSGAGGASKAFEHNDGLRMREICQALGFTPFPGSLNVHLTEPFDWNRMYYRCLISDVAERGKGLDVEWRERWARIYPLSVGYPAFAFRFEGETYPANFVELIAPDRLRDIIDPQQVELCQ